MILSESEVFAGSREFVHLHVWRSRGMNGTVIGEEEVSD